MKHSSENRLKNVIRQQSFGHIKLIYSIFNYLSQSVTVSIDFILSEAANAKRYLTPTFSKLRVCIHIIVQIEENTPVKTVLKKIIRRWSYGHLNLNLFLPILTKFPTVWYEQNVIHNGVNATVFPDSDTDIETNGYILCPQRKSNRNQPENLQVLAERNRKKSLQVLAERTRNRKSPCTCREDQKKNTLSQYKRHSLF